MAHLGRLILTLAFASAVWAQAGTRGPKFFPDDPIQTMPRPHPVMEAKRQTIDQASDFLNSAGRAASASPHPAGAVNTLGEALDTEWFTNRHGTRRMTREQLQRGVGNGMAPEPPFRINGGKSEGITPGFTLEDRKGRKYFVKVDPPHNREMMTAAEAIVSRFFYAIGYYTPANDVVRLRLSDLSLSKDAKLSDARGAKRRMTWDDVLDLVDRVPHYHDGSFRIVTSLALEGKAVGLFRYEGLRLDDPNDIVPHEDRRDLRGLYVFSAWLNNTDMRAGNTFDAVVDWEGTPVIRHFLIDFGSALGSDGDRPKDPRVGHEFMMPSLSGALKSIFTLGLVPEPWERIHYPKEPAIGNLEARAFDPDRWKSDYPNPAFLSRLPDDDFWAARIVMAFTNDDIRAIVETGQFSDAAVPEHLTALLSERRDKIGRAFFTKVLPLVDFKVQEGRLEFEDLAVRHGFRTPLAYRVRWTRFDIWTREHTPITGSAAAVLPSEFGSAPAGAYYAATIDSAEGGSKSVIVYLRKETAGPKVVGIDRTW